MSRDWDRLPAIDLRPRVTLTDALRDRSVVMEEFRGYSSARKDEESQLDALRSNSKVMRVVLQRVKGSIERTYDIPVKCGENVIGAVAFGIKETDGNALVELIWINPRVDDPEGSDEYDEYRLTGPGTAGTKPVSVPCECDLSHLPDNDPVRFRLSKSREGTRHTRLWFYKKALEALAADTRKRPVVQLHT